MEHISADEMRRYMDLYNVGWVMVFTDYSRNQIEERMKGFLEPYGRAGMFSVFRVLREPSYFIKGSGELRASLNRLELSHVTPENGEVVLSMHYLETFRSEPPRHIQRARIEGLPVGFIRILDPAEHMVLINDSRIPWKMFRQQMKIP